MVKHMKVSELTASTLFSHLVDLQLLGVMDIDAKGVLQSSPSPLLRIVQGEVPLSFPLSLFDFFEKDSHAQLQSLLDNAVSQQDVSSGSAVFLNTNQTSFLFAFPLEKERLRLVFPLPQENYKEDDKFTTLGFLTSGVAHDLNNVFTGLLNLSDMLQTQAKDSKIRSYTQAISDGIELGSELTQSITHFLKGGKQKERYVRPYQCLEEIKPLLKSCLNAKISLYIECSEDDFFLPLSHTELSQIILNLTVNAHDSIENYGEIRIKGSYDAPFFTMTVADTGEGFEKPLAELNNGGLGLSIVQRILKNYHGHIQIDSQPQEGTKITVQIPVQKDSTD